MNEGVKLANNVLGLDLTTYTQAWGDYPIPVVLGMAALGLLGSVEEITGAASNIADSLDRVDIADPETAAKAYLALSNIRSILARMAKKREEDNLLAERELPAKPNQE